MKIEPYLNFEGRCEEAIEFYKSALGAKVEMILRCKDSPQPPAGGQTPPEFLNKILHSSLRIGDSIVMATDGHCKGTSTFTGISLSLTATVEADAQRMFAALSDGGTVTMPLSKTFFSPCFGMVTDRFGVVWMVLTQA